MPTLMGIRHHLYANSLVCSSTHKGNSMIVRLSRALLLVRLVLCLFAAVSLRVQVFLNTSKSHKFSVSRVASLPSS